MAWCRWADAQTMCTYLITRNLSNDINPQNLLRHAKSSSIIMGANGSNSPGLDYEKLSDLVVEKLGKANLSSAHVPNVLPHSLGNKKENYKQQNLKPFVAQKEIPTAKCAKDAWTHWFVSAPHLGLMQPLKDLPRALLSHDGKKYSERATLSLAFAKYSSYKMFEAAFTGFTMTYTMILREVRRCRRENCM